MDNPINTFCALELKDISGLSLSRKFYYLLKPLIPVKMQLWLRRAYVRAQAQQHRQTWPVYAPSAQKPAGWPGWPDGKQFCLLLTHDVDSQAGNEKVPQLVHLERSMGVVSSFFFVPETYPWPERHFELLRKSGFEIGVHGLKHDGRLYSSEKKFLRTAYRINQYVQLWGASGFRAPCMHHNLDWQHFLNIAYDASTYDTDPFEPQGGGTGTIFPFQVRHPETGHCYIELPYTLPQDFLLYVLMREKGIDIWKRKLDWIAERGGMAHVITHPDYMNFNREPGPEKTYPVQHYVDFLKYIQSAYRDRYWQATCREAAEYYREHALQAPVKFSAAPPALVRTCMLVFSYYPMDVRVRREAEALQESGMAVDVVCLKMAGQPALEVINGVTVHRLPLDRSRKESKFDYLKEYFLFCLLSFFKLAKLHAQKKHAVVHVHTMPDFLVFCALIPRLAGARIILDLHDPTPEIYMTKYSLPESHPFIRLLRLIERWSIKFSDLAITPNIAFKDLFASRSCVRQKMQLVMNSPQEHLFYPRSTRSPSGYAGKGQAPFTIMFHGVIVERHGLDTALAAIVRLRSRIDGVGFEVYGQGEYVERFLELRRELRLEDTVFYRGPVPQEDIPEGISRCSVGLIPNNRSPFTEINLPTRIFEYLCMNRPVVAPRTRGILDYFQEDEMFYFEPGNAESLYRVLLEVCTQPETVRLKMEKGRAVYLQHTWNDEKRTLVEIVRQVGRSDKRFDPCDLEISN